MFRGSPRPRETVWSHQRGEAESGGQSPPPPIPTRAAPSAPSQLQLLHPTWEGPLPLLGLGIPPSPPRSAQPQPEASLSLYVLLKGTLQI